MLNKDVQMLRLFALSGFVLTACYDKAPPAASEQRTTQAGSSILLDTQDNDNDGFSEIMGDCNDSDPSIAPDAEEICDNIDNDCDGLTDEDATDGVTGYVDADNDGFGDGNMPVQACPAWFSDPYVDHLSPNDLDCNDEDPAINPGARELCDGVDSDCNPDNNGSGADGTPVYADTDGDGFGVSPKTGLICLDADFPELGFPSEPEPGTSLFATDCDDADEMIHPTADEYCNETDNDCDGVIDNAAIDRVEWFHDADGDGFGNTDISLGIHCSLASMADNGDDCDDADASIHPDAVEICDGVDNDCNGGDDEGLTNVYFLDSDDDGYGDPSAPGEFCDDPGEGFSDNNEDCNDADAAINPGAEDTAGDEIDQNCDGTELCFVDADDDGWTADSPAILASADALCSGPGEAMATDPAGDCDDTDAGIGSIDFDADCDGTLTDEDCDDDDSASTAIADDADCDSVITAEDCDDDDVALGAISADADCDGTLTSDDCNDDDPASTVFANDADCDGFITTADCNDSDAAINPDAYDTLDDGIDNNCDGGDWVTCDASYEIVGPTPSLNISALEFCGAVTGNVIIEGTDLTDTSGLSRLRTVGESLILYGNASMTSIELPNLTAVGDELEVDSHDALVSLDLSSLTEVGDMLIVTNDDLSSIGMGNLNTVSGFLAIFDNPALTSLEANSLTTIGEDFYIHSNEALTMASFNALAEVGDDFEVVDNTVLTTMDLSSLTSVGDDLGISLNASLTSVSMDSLTSAGGDLSFIENHALTSISMAGLETVAEDLEIGANSGLESVVFSSLSSIGENLSILQTDLETLSGFNQLTHVDGDISIGMNLNLSSLTGFNNLETTTDLWIQNHPILDDIAGFEALTTVSGSLLVQYNDGLDAISGFDNLTNVGEQLSIVGNELLTSIDGLYGIDTIGGYLQIRVNALLCSSEVDAFVASIDAIFGLGSMHGTFNNDGC
jgi:hypothetical protein